MGSLVSFDAKTKFVGLVTAVGEVGVDAGALKVADNVTLRKSGTLSSRPTFTSTALPRAYAAAFPYRGALVYMAANNVLYSAAGAAITTQANQTPPGVSPGSVRADVQAAKETRGNLYVPSSLGTYKLVTPADLQLYNTGLLPTDATITQISAVATGSSDLLVSGQQVAYKVVTTITDPNGVIVRSRPSGAVTFVASGSVSPSITISHKGFVANAAAIRTIELYRTRVFPSTAQVDDEYQLVATRTPAPGSTSSLSITDKVPDISRSTTLYTSPSRGGIENANDRPPAAACVERFRTSLFFGNTVGPQRVTLSYSPSGANLAGSATGIGVRETTGTTVNGNANITAVANTTGVQVGMRVTTATSALYYTVTAIAGSTVTVTPALNANQTAQQVRFYDAVSIDGASTILGTGFSTAFSFWTTSGALTWSDAAVKDSYTAYEITPPVAGSTQTVVIERITRGGAPFVVKATHGDEMNPAYPLTTAGTGTSSTNDVYPHGLSWSEPDEPEHVPPKNFARVGDAGKAILALVATKDRLLIWKEDGLFMLTGDTSKNFGIYPLDTTCLCILPGSVKRLQNTVYALTNLGLVAVDDTGSVQVVSRSIQNEIAVIVLAIRAAQQSSGLYNMPGLSGVTGAADDANGEYWLALGSTTPSFGGQILVYNAFAQGFTTYTHAGVTPVALSADATGLPLTLTTNSVLSAGYIYGPVLARIAPHAFSDPALVGKFWTHIVAGMSWISGVGSVTAKFSSSESMRITGLGYVTETVDVPVNEVSVINLPSGSLLRHPVPLAMRRGFLLFVELAVDVTAVNGLFVLDFFGAESREDIPNKRPVHNLTGA